MFYGFYQCHGCKINIICDTGLLTMDDSLEFVSPTSQSLNRSKCFFII